MAEGFDFFVRNKQGFGFGWNLLWNCFGFADI